MSENFFSQLKLLTFPGGTSAGDFPVLGADPGDIILSVASVTAAGLTKDYTGSFLKGLQFNPTAASGQSYALVTQVSSVDLSALIFVALLKKGSGFAG